MPIYEFQCLSCTEKIIEIKNEPENKDNEDIQHLPDKYIFEVNGTMSDPPHEANCPECQEFTKTRIFTPVAIHYGLTAIEKAAGTTKKRFEMGKYMKDQRDKRQKEADPNSRDAQSNELWTNSEAQTKLLKDVVSKKSVL
jgi:hypothetical protein